MSEHGSVSGEHGEPQVISTSDKGASKGKAKDMMQVETIKELDEIISDFIAQKSSLHDACRFLATTLGENPSLMVEQCSETYRIYGGWVKEAYAAQMQAITCGECGPNCTPGRADPSGEDGAQESDADDEVGAPIEDLPGPG